MTRLLSVCAALTALAISAPSAGAADDRERPAGPPQVGKFGCSESVFHLDHYESEARGFVTLLDAKRYRQGKGRVGTYRYNAKSGVTTFTGGGLGGSTATGIDGKRTRLFITVKFSDGETANWACSWISKK
jgi:hypothetical protein